MPVHRGVALSLQSQYDALSVPEFIPPQPSPRSDDSTVEVFTPIYPGSQFWIVFSCLQPVEPGVRHHFFKLLANGTCLLSWGCGRASNGRIGFGIFDGQGQNYQGQHLIEKRAFVFPAETECGSFQIQVFRAKARRREEPRLEQYEEVAEGKGLKVNIAGYMQPHEPRKKYAYALLDPLSKPHVTFIYHCLPGKQLRELGLNLPSDYDVKDITRAPPSKSVGPFVGPVSPPPKEKPLPPPNGYGYAGKDSLALRRAMPPRIRFAGDARIEQESPVKKNEDRRKENAFDAMEGLSLAAGSGQPQRSASLFKGMARRLKRKMNSRDERRLSVFEDSIVEN